MFTDYTTRCNGEVLNEKNIPEYSQTSFVEFFSANNDIYEISLSDRLYYKLWMKIISI